MARGHPAPGKSHLMLVTTAGHRPCFCRTIATVLDWARAEQPSSLSPDLCTRLSGTLHHGACSHHLKPALFSCALPSLNGSRSERPDGRTPETFHQDLQAQLFASCRSGLSDFSDRLPSSAFTSSFPAVGAGPCAARKGNSLVVPALVR